MNSRTKLVSTFSCVWLFVVGCVGPDSAEHAARHIEDGAAKLSNAIVNAADKVDPFMIKEILRENHDLSEQIKKLNEAAQSVTTNPGVVHLRDGSLWLEFITHGQYPEEHSIRIYLDDKVLEQKDWAGDKGDDHGAVNLDQTLSKPGRHKMQMSYFNRGGMVISFKLVFRPATGSEKRSILEKDFNSQNPWPSTQDPRNQNYKLATESLFEFDVAWDNYHGATGK